jgi:Mrp family chromosome partitioning ATPase
MLDFHARNLTHKPKLVGVTGCGKSSGVTTVAAGLAQSLSETGDGSVLLVELNLEQGLALSHFCHGKPGFTLSEMMDEAVLNNAADHKDLYLVSPGKNNGASSMVVYQKLAELMPRLKVSQLDYVVFDMPPVSLMTPTAKLAGMLDTTLLVVASGETQRAAVTRALSLLRESEATVMPILNKSHSYLPRWLENRVQS